jgi:hypothetical protein
MGQGSGVAKSYFSSRKTTLRYASYHINNNVAMKYSSPRQIPLRYFLLNSQPIHRRAMNRLRLRFEVPLRKAYCAYLSATPLADCRFAAM